MYWKDLNGKYLKGYAHIWKVERLGQRCLYIKVCKPTPTSVSRTDIEFEVDPEGEEKCLMPSAVPKYFQVLKPWDRVWSESLARSER